MLFRKNNYLCNPFRGHLGVAQLVAHLVRDQEVACSSQVTQTKSRRRTCGFFYFSELDAKADGGDAQVTDTQIQETTEALADLQAEHRRLSGDAEFFHDRIVAVQRSHGEHRIGAEPLPLIPVKLDAHHGGTKAVIRTGLGHIFVEEIHIRAREAQTHHIGQAVEIRHANRADRDDVDLCDAGQSRRNIGQLLQPIAIKFHIGEAAVRDGYLVTIVRLRLCGQGHQQNQETDDIFLHRNCDFHKFTTKIRLSCFFEEK